MAVAHLLVHRTSGFMHQSNIVVLISNDDCIKVGKHLKISDGLIDRKVPYLRWISTAADSEDSDELLPPAEIKLVLLIRILDVLNVLHMHELAEFYICKVLVVETYLIASCDADTGKRNHFKHQPHAEFVGVYG